MREPDCAADRLPPRQEEALRMRQREGRLRVLAAADFRRLVGEVGLEEAYLGTDVVVAASAEFTDQASLHLSLGPTDPPIRLREPQLGGVSALAAGAGGDLVLPIGGSSGASGGGAQVLVELIEGRSVELGAGGDATPLQPRRELHTHLDLERIGLGRLTLQRGIVENGVVAVNRSQGVIHTAFGPLLGPCANALYSCGGAGSIGLAMPGLALLGPGSPLLVAGGIGWVVGAGSGHQPNPRRLPLGHARSPGAVAAVSVDLHDLEPGWLRPCRFEGHGSALLVPIAAPVPLIDGAVARQVAAPDDVLEAPVLDFAIPRRIKPNFGYVSYQALHEGQISIEGQLVRAAPAHSPRLAAAIATELITRLREDRFPLRLPLVPLTARPALVPLDP